jgi:hypothetical protein
MTQGQRGTNDPNSARGISLQSRLLITYAYLLDQRLYAWAEETHAIPNEQHGYRAGRPTETAIKILSDDIHEALDLPKTPLYVCFVDFAKAFDSINRTLLFQKLHNLNIPTTFLRALWPLINENFVQIISGESLSKPIVQTKGVPRGQSLSPHLYSLFTHDLPSTLNDPVNVKTLVYADDLAIYSRNLDSLQCALNRLELYCVTNDLRVNTAKTEVVKFRRGGRFCKSDKLLYQGSEIAFVSDFKYLRVKLHTKGGFKGHVRLLRGKGIAACHKVASKMPMEKISLYLWRDYF